MISGDPDKEKLFEAWSKIYEDYAAEIGGQEAKMYLQMFKEFTILDIDYKSVLIAIEALEVYKRFADTPQMQTFSTFLNKTLRTNYDFKPDNPDYEKHLKSCKTRSGSMKINLDLKAVSFEALKKKQESKQGAKLERSYFVGVLIALSNHAKYNITENITVLEYCTRIKQLNLYLEHLSKK